ncbi:MAG: hypothetical protein ACPG5B_13020 [Chitinophagales bacterium]
MQISTFCHCEARKAVKECKYQLFVTARHEAVQSDKRQDMKLNDISLVSAYD